MGYSWAPGWVLAVIDPTAILSTPLAGLPGVRVPIADQVNSRARGFG